MKKIEQQVTDITKKPLEEEIQSVESQIHQFKVERSSIQRDRVITGTEKQKLQTKYSELNTKSEKWVKEFQATLMEKVREAFEKVLANPSAPNGTQCGRKRQRSNGVQRQPRRQEVFLDPAPAIFNVERTSPKVTPPAAPVLAPPEVEAEDSETPVVNPPSSIVPTSINLNKIQMTASPMQDRTEISLEKKKAPKQKYSDLLKTPKVQDEPDDLLEMLDEGNVKCKTPQT